MQLVAKVAGTVVSTRKNAKLEGEAPARATDDA
jgi:microcompartment protein CcmK/EutM